MSSQNQGQVGAGGAAGARLSLPPRRQRQRTAGWHRTQATDRTKDCHVLYWDLDKTKKQREVRRDGIGMGVFFLCVCARVCCPDVVRWRWWCWRGFQLVPSRPSDARLGLGLEISKRFIVNQLLLMRAELARSLALGSRSFLLTAAFEYFISIIIIIFYQRLERRQTFFSPPLFKI